ncbi:helix-turn-helix domain-containing protein [Streptomyces sp. TRM 70351]|uniref:helix-turn-helix domain-containing protein n=1 Tax=Streptomyces sp. TRM 70351 TaxID=3116552 RepID=UPI002E7BA24B|nr:helix-turn-helix domain-containing protein [Streptomyces sp. TRM 70351]MEE1929830.1 helix-turn-helix domain-containing protein [Streptomyces sp. TRM 70351]
MIDTAPGTPEVLTVPEVMTALRLSRFKVYDLIRSKQLRSITIGRARRIPAAALAEFISNQMEEAA